MHEKEEKEGLLWARYLIQNLKTQGEMRISIKESRLLIFQGGKEVREEGISQLGEGRRHRKEGMDEFIGDHGCQDAGCQRR